MRIPRKQLDASIPSAAMGDIAFLLIIFFVVLARVQDDSHVQWRPAKAPELEPAGQTVASVAIDADNKTFLNGKEIGVSELVGGLEALLGNRPEGERSVLLKVDRESTAQYFEPAIEAISMAGGSIIHVLEREEESSR